MALRCQERAPSTTSIPDETGLTDPGRFLAHRIPWVFSPLGYSSAWSFAVRGDEHGDGRPAIGFDFVVVLCFRLIEACDHQEIGSFEKRGKQAGGPERIGHVQNRLRVQLTQQGLDLGDDMGWAGFKMELA